MIPDFDFDIDITKFPWPDDATHMFREGEPNAHFVWIPQTSGQWHLYAEGYRQAAERVFESWRAQRDDCLVYPIVFLYRHYVELRLKELLQSAEQLLELERNWQSNHKIAELWEVLKKLLQKIAPSEPACDLQNAERLVIELATRDPDSFEFRYPETKDGRKYLADLERIDLVNFCDAMRKLSGFLEGASGLISFHLSSTESSQ